MFSFNSIGNNIHNKLIQNNQYFVTKSRQSIYVFGFIVLSIFHNLIISKYIMFVYIHNKDTFKNNYCYNYSVFYVTYYMSNKMHQKYVQLVIWIILITYSSIGII